MLKKYLPVVTAVVLLAFMAGAAYAVQPGREVNPNGFPSGAHYNLNIIGKGNNFTCPAQEYSDGELMYGNVVFVPQNGSNIEIFMQSGKGKKAAAITELQAIDPCASFDGDGAVIQLPPNDLGYRVYARALAKPTGEPTFETLPDLAAVEDEAGNDLLYLGLVTGSGFQTPYASFARKKGQSRAVDITGLFEWTGDVCYFTRDYCEPVNLCTTETLCCADPDFNGIYDQCYYKGTDLCQTGYVELTAYCRYYEDEWVFNIGDFVTYLWDVTNNGMKLLQVRFYPVSE